MTPLSESSDSLDHASQYLGKVITCRVRIKKASSLPAILSHFVFCQYSFFNLSELLVVAPKFDPTANEFTHNHSFQFDHQKVCSSALSPFPRTSP